MKGGGGGGVPTTTKRRWKGVVVIAVLGLVFFSMLVPLVFLLGQHNNAFHSAIGYGSQQHKSQPKRVKVFNQQDAPDKIIHSKVPQSTHMEDVIRKLAPNIPKDFANISFKESVNETNSYRVPADIGKQVKKNKGILDRHNGDKNKTDGDDNEMLCELKFGSYCLWRREHRENMGDSVVKRMKDLLFVARAYYPSIAKLPAFDKLSHEMRQNIQDFERILSETTTDKDIPPQIEKKLSKMESVIVKAKSCHVDCNNVDKKFRQLVDLTEDESNFHMKQSAFLYKLAVQTMPKSLHCLSMRLTVEHFKSSLDVEQKLVKKFVNPGLYHYIIFSRNVLASAAVINSTIVHAKESEKQVFHLLTDRENYFAMRLWFSGNEYHEAAIQVLNIEDPKLYNRHMVAPLHLALPEEFRVSFLRVDKLSSTTQIRTEYLSMFSHSHYLLPEIFQTLEKVVVLDDDVIVQRDLSALWNLDMGGKVNGAVEFCGLKLFNLKNDLSGKGIDDSSCAWTSGVNLIDLSLWRIHNLTETYEKLVHKMSKDEGLSESTTLSASLLTFQGLVYFLEDSWMLSGLGHNYGLDLEALKTAAVLHFDGSMKPWLELGIPAYKKFWRKFLNLQNPFLSDCNVNP